MSGVGVRGREQGVGGEFLKKNRSTKYKKNEHAHSDNNNSTVTTKRNVQNVIYWGMVDWGGRLKHTNRLDG